MQGRRKAEVLGRGKNVRERKVRVGSRREVENKKNSHRQNNRNTENKKLLPGSRTEAQSKRNKKPQGEGRVTHSTTLRE